MPNRSSGLHMRPPGRGQCRADGKRAPKHAAAESSGGEAVLLQVQEAAKNYAF